MSQITPHARPGRPVDDVSPVRATRQCHRCGTPITAWKRKDRAPTVRSGLCADCRESDPGYLALVLGREAPEPPDYDPETAAWVAGESVAYEVVRAERFDVAAIQAERPAIIAARQRALDIAAAQHGERTMTDADVRREAAERVRRYEQAAMDARGGR